MSCAGEDILTAENISQACLLLNYLAKNSAQYNSPLCRPLRTALQPLFEQQQERMFGGETLSEHKSRLQKKKRAESMRAVQRQEDKKLLQNTQLRADRMKRLIQIDSQEGVDIPLIQDGVGNDGRNITVLPVQIESEKMQPCLLNEAPESHTELGISHASTELQHDPLLNKFRSCYVCKRRFSQLHHFYHSLCPNCATLNWARRMQMCDMTGRICLVTGGRVKIGFQCCLKLLRCGATVISTSRFPVDAAKRFAAQADFSTWRDRVVCIGLDLRDLPYLEYTCQHLIRTFDKLDVVINNACQTIRRPRGYYQPLLEAEGVVMSALLDNVRYLDQHPSNDSEVRGVSGGSQDTHVRRSDLPSGGGGARDQSFLKDMLCYDAQLRSCYASQALPPPALASGTVEDRRLDDGSGGSENGGKVSLTDKGGAPQSSTSPIQAGGLTSADMSQLALLEEDVSVVYGGAFLPAGGEETDGACAVM